MAFWGGFVGAIVGILLLGVISFAMDKKGD
jgi:hypothetical protein